jgi:hypothetical protein
MALDRTEAATELANRSGRALVAVGRNTTDTTGNLREPLDDTFRALGVAWGDLATATVEEGDLDRFLAIGAVFVIRRALDEAAGFADVAATALGTSKRKSQIVKNLTDQLNRAESYAAQYGVAGLTSVMGSGVVILDVLEPEEVNA